VSGFVPSAFFPVGAAPLSGVTPPAATSEAVASGGSVTGWTFGAFTDPDGRIASYSATLVTVTGSGSLSGSGLGPYSITGTTDGDAYTVELDALDGDGGVLATAVHTVAIASGALLGSYEKGGAVLFDGVDQSISFAGSLNIASNTSTLTLSAWFRTTSGTNYQKLAGIDDGTNGLLLSVTRTTVYGFWRQGNGYGWTSAKTIPALDIDFWVHVLLVSIAGATPTCKIYINGSSVAASWTLGGGATWPISASGASLDLGLPRLGFNNYFDGQAAEVAVWNSDQSANIAAIYNSRQRHNLMDLPTPPDVYYAPLSVNGDNTDGTAGGVYELVGNNDGTGVNMDGSERINLADAFAPSTL
jgi:hypothetical protein